MPAAFKVGSKPSKYKNVPTIYGGIRYQSKAEAMYAANLDLVLRAGQLRGWTRQVPFYLGCPENRYVVDFVVWALDGTSVAVDVKGVETGKFKRDKKLWAAYGPCPLVIVKGGKIAETIVGKASATT